MGAEGYCVLLYNCIFTTHFRLEGEKNEAAKQVMLPVYYTDQKERGRIHTKGNWGF